MLYSLLRPMLFSLDAERAHRMGMAVMRAMAQHRPLAEWVHAHLARPAPIPTRVAGLDFPNPIGLAAGLDKNAEAPLAWWAVGFGFAELGTITPRPQLGKPRPRLFRFPQMNALVNRMGFNNDGAEIVAQRLMTQNQNHLRPTFPTGISIGKNATTPPEQAVDDYASAATTLSPHADYLAINISSPNTPGLRDLQSQTQVTRIIQAVRTAVPGKPVFVKLAPELTRAALEQVLDACLQSGAAGIISTNTLATLGRDGLPQGGLSGRPLREISLRQVAAVRNHVGSQLAIIGCGGIDDANSARSMFSAGADLVQLYTGFIYKGPFLPAQITRQLSGIDPPEPL